MKDPIHYIRTDHLLQDCQQSAFQVNPTIGELTEQQIRSNTQQIIDYQQQMQQISDNKVDQMQQLIDSECICDCSDEDYSQKQQVQFRRKHYWKCKQVQIDKQNYQQQKQQDLMDLGLFQKKALRRSCYDPNYVFDYQFNSPYKSCKQRQYSCKIDHQKEQLVNSIFGGLSKPNNHHKQKSQHKNQQINEQLDLLIQEKLQLTIQYERQKKNEQARNKKQKQKQKQKMKQYDEEIRIFNRNKKYRRQKEVDQEWLTEQARQEIRKDKKIGYEVQKNRRKINNIRENLEVEKEERINQKQMLNQVGRIKIGIMDKTDQLFMDQQVDNRQQQKGDDSEYDYDQMMKYRMHQANMFYDDQNRQMNRQIQARK